MASPILPRALAASAIGTLFFSVLNVPFATQFVNDGANPATVLRRGAARRITLMVAAFIFAFQGSPGTSDRD